MYLWRLMNYKQIICFFVFVLATGCKKEITSSDLTHINGYWEIEKVTMSDGSHKEYRVNEIIDYFEMHDGKGFRKKVRPQFDGKYKSAGEPEAISVTFKDGKAILHYSTQYMEWQEEVEVLNSDQLILQNQEGTEYRYKRAVPFNIK